jgi:predicted transcriptional regulator
MSTVVFIRVNHITDMGVKASQRLLRRNSCPCLVSGLLFRYHCTVKVVKILLSEDLVTEFDETAEVRERGRSAVLRQLVGDFLRQRRERELDTQYERAYKQGDSPLGEEFEGWENPSSEEQIRQIEEGLREADAGDFASDEEVAAVFAKWTERPISS